MRAATKGEDCDIKQLEPDGIPLLHGNRRRIIVNACMRKCLYSDFSIACIFRLDFFNVHSSRDPLFSCRHSSDCYYFRPISIGSWLRRVSYRPSLVCPSWSVCLTRARAPTWNPVRVGGSTDVAMSTADGDLGAAYQSVDARRARMDQLRLAHLQRRKEKLLGSDQNGMCCPANTRVTTLRARAEMLSR